MISRKSCRWLLNARSKESSSSLLEKPDTLPYRLSVRAPRLFPRLILRHFSNRFLRLADALLDFSLDLLARIASDSSGDLIGLAFDLLGFPGGNIFASH